MLDLQPIKDRAEKAWSYDSKFQVAADIYALIAEVERLRHEVGAYEFLVRKHRDLFVTEMAELEAKK